jgi:MFS family permease
MFSTYAAVLDRRAHPGALLFSLTGIVARLPISMVGLGIVLLVESERGSYGVAGAVSAVYLVANAVLAVVQGRLLDALGQRVVLTAASTGFAVALAVLIASVAGGWPMPVTYAAAALAGGSLPQIGSAVRARWSHVLDAPGDVQTAFALEAVFDEVVFILGPILVTVLATLVHPVAGLVTAAVAGAAGSLAFAAQRRTEPVARPHDRTEGARLPLPWRTLAPLALAAGSLGILFGAAEVTTVAFADEQGHRAWSGGLLALWALGSLTAGVVTGTITWRVGVVTRLRVGALAMALAMAPLVLVDSLALMGLLLLVGGAAIAPTMIATMTLTEQRMPRSRLTEGMAVVQTGLVVGVAPGAALSGLVVDHAGASAAYLVSLGAGLLGACAALLVPTRSTPVVDRDLEPVR